jgi:hypothetical protein
MVAIDTEHWILEGREGWVADLLRGCIKNQPTILSQFTEQEKMESQGFGCRMVVTGEDGGVFDLMFGEAGIQPKPPEVPIRNIVQLSEGTLLDVIYPDLTNLRVKTDGREIIGFEALAYYIEHDGIETMIAKLRPRKTLARALANQDIMFDGENPDIDSVVWSRIFDKVLYGVAFPLVIRTIWKPGKK